MDKSDVITFYKSYKSLILKEMQEFLDQPLNGIKPIDGFNYRVYEGDIAAIFTFRRIYLHDNPNFDGDDKNAYSLSWRWDDSVKSKKNFLRVLASGYQVINDFILNKSPDVISFGGLSKGHETLYAGGTFQKRLKTLFGEEYDVVTNDDVIYIIHKTISKVKNESISKRSEITSMQESIIYWKYPHLHPSTPKNVRIKSKIKKRIIENLYFKKWL
jgi:hypothetical protein